MKNIFIPITFLHIQKEIETTKVLKKSISANCAEANYKSATFISDNVFSREL